METPLDEIFGKHEGSLESLIAVLQDIQEKYHYLSEDNMREVAKRFNVPVSQVFSVAHFYTAFSLEPKGEYIIQVCMGTACHVRGAPRILEELERLLEIKDGETTEDKRFSLETVNCVGACALGPVMIINGEYHGHLNPAKVEKIIKAYMQK
ncbi:MAG: complex I 24 kDa subunit family protein [bacterium]